MKALLIAGLVVVAGCADEQRDGRWHDMYVDMHLRQKYERYSCPNCIKLRKEGCTQGRAAAIARIKEQPAKVQPQPVQNDIQEVNRQIDQLKDAVMRNAEATNQNEKLITEQIKELKAQKQPSMPVGTMVPNQ